MGEVVRVKLYSEYTDAIPAPQGLSTKTVPLQFNKWSHYLSSQKHSIYFSILLQADISQKVRFQVFGNEAKIYQNLVSLMADEFQIVQFSAKCPTLSCKYLLQCAPQSIPIMRRFQLVFDNQNDFFKVVTQLTTFGFKVKTVNVRHQVSNPNQQQKVTSSAFVIPCLLYTSRCV